MERRMQLMHRAEEQPQTPNPSTPGPPTPGPSTPGPINSNQPVTQNTNSKGGLVTTVKPMVSNGKPGMNTPFSPQPNMQQPQQQQQMQQPGQQQQGQQIFQNTQGGSAPIGAVIAAQEVVNIAMQEHNKTPSLPMRQVCIAAITFFFNWWNYIYFFHLGVILIL